jgi:hypothetical protein
MENFEWRSIVKELNLPLKRSTTKVIGKKLRLDKGQTQQWDWTLST